MYSLLRILSLFSLLMFAANYANAAETYHVSGAAIENNLSIALATKDVASANFYAINLEQQGLVDSDGNIQNINPFMQYITQRLKTIIKVYPSVRGYGLFFSGIKFSAKALTELKVVLESIQVPERHVPLAQALLQLGFTDNSVSNDDVLALISLIKATPNLSFLDLAHNKDCDDLTTLIITLNGLKHFIGLDTRLTALNSQSTIFLLRSMLQSDWNGVAMSVDDVFEANALQEVLKRKHLRHLGIHFQSTVGPNATDAVLETLLKTQKNLRGLHLGFPQDYEFTPKEINSIVTLIAQNPHLHTLTLNAPSLNQNARQLFYQALAKNHAIYGLGLSSNFFQDQALHSIVQAEPFLLAIQPIGLLQDSELRFLNKLVGNRPTCIDTSRMKVAGTWQDMPLNKQTICSLPTEIKKQKNNWNTLDRINPP